MMLVDRAKDDKIEVWKAKIWEKEHTNEVLDKIKAEISEYGSMCVEYNSDKDIETIVEDVLAQAKKQVLDVIDKYREGCEDETERARFKSFDDLRYFNGY